MKERRKNRLARAVVRNASKIYACKVELTECKYNKEGKCKLHADVHCRNRSRAENWTGYAVD